MSLSKVNEFQKDKSGLLAGVSPEKAEGLVIRRKSIVLGAFKKSYNFPKILPF